MGLTRGMRLGPYEILAPIGAGGMGEVYKARDTRLSRDVAVKVLPAEFTADPERLRRFEQEARAAAALNHPNILVLYDIGTREGAPYIVTELLEGQTLRRRTKDGAMTPAGALDLGVQIAQGLAAAHDKGIIHRDIKLENLWITKDGRVKIHDFGLARLRAMEPVTTPDPEAPTVDRPTREGTLLGTPAYMSPEQAEGKPVDARSDLFSFGAVLYEMVAGRRAFDGDSPASILSAILTKTPPPVRSLRPGVPTGLDDILKRRLDKGPEHRYPSAETLCKDLTACHDTLVHPSITLRSLLKSPRFVVPAALVLAPDRRAGGHLRPSRRGDGRGPGPLPGEPGTLPGRMPRVRVPPAPPRRVRRPGGRSPLLKLDALPGGQPPPGMPYSRYSQSRMEVA